VDDARNCCARRRAIGSPADCKRRCEYRGEQLERPGAGTKPIRLLLVDNQPAVRRGLRMRFALEPDLEVIGEAGDATEAISLAQTLGPDVVLMDVDMSGIDGILAIAM
jgi:PleD family two-component response regulator